MTTENIILTPEELEAITGLKYPGSQIKWLSKRDWFFVVNSKNKPVVGRYYASMKLAGKDLNYKEQSLPLPRFENTR